MELITLLCKLFEGEWDKSILNTILLISYPNRDVFRVYQNLLTKEAYDQLKETTMFVTLEKTGDEQLYKIIHVIKPFARAHYDNVL